MKMIPPVVSDKTKSDAEREVFNLLKATELGGRSYALHSLNISEHDYKLVGELDFVVHSIAFSPKEALQGRVVDVEREGFRTTMDVSCWTFMRMVHLAEPLMRKGGSLFTMTYYGSQMVVKNYNIMGVAKAALESAVRYIAAELGPKGIRVHAISPGPLATRAASGIPEFDALLDKAKAKARRALFAGSGRPKIEPVVRRGVAVEREVGPIAGLEAVVGPLEVEPCRRRFQTESHPRNRQLQFVALPAPLHFARR